MATQEQLLTKLEGMLNQGIEKDKLIYQILTQQEKQNQEFREILTQQQKALIGEVEGIIKRIVPKVTADLTKKMVSTLDLHQRVIAVEGAIAKAPYKEGTPAKKNKKKKRKRKRKKDRTKKKSN